MSIARYALTSECGTVECKALRQCLPDSFPMSCTLPRPKMSLKRGRIVGPTRLLRVECTTMSRECDLE